ncbi:hypothetical protein QJS04_geneDACA006651 [Acorus gramineus]|uniref:Uncharacterized protein n=1 Tax=Acorus gramineus TaxID=55184 RepID=A0AAV9AWY1_ACOGR|nr:hypothetical protein QJS04_geneDACA006651 [Acorus gramineus]
MAKQKVVLKFTKNSSKSPAKALQAVVKAPGVISAEVEGDDKSQVAIVGENMDCMVLVKLLKKKMGYNFIFLRRLLKMNIGYVELVTVAPVEGEKKDKNKIKVEDLPPIWPNYQVVVAQDYMGQPPYRYWEPCCIM